MSDGVKGYGHAFTIPNKECDPSVFTDKKKEIFVVQDTVTGLVRPTTSADPAPLGVLNKIGSRIGEHYFCGVYPFFPIGRYLWSSSTFGDQKKGTSVKHGDDGRLIVATSGFALGYLSHDGGSNERLLVDISVHVVGGVSLTQQTLYPILKHTALATDGILRLIDDVNYHMTFKIANDVVRTSDFKPHTNDVWYALSNNFSDFVTPPPSPDHRTLLYLFTGAPSASTIVGTVNNAFDASSVTRIYLGSSGNATADIFNSTKKAFTKPSVDNKIYVHADAPYVANKYLTFTVTAVNADVGTGNGKVYDLTVTTTQTGGNFFVGDNNYMRVTEELPGDITVPGNQVEIDNSFLDRLGNLSDWNAEVNSAIDFEKIHIDEIILDSIKLDNYTNIDANTGQFTGANGQVQLTQGTGTPIPIYLTITFNNNAGTSNETQIRSIVIGDKLVLEVTEDKYVTVKIKTIRSDQVINDVAIGKQFEVVIDESRGLDAYDTLPAGSAKVYIKSIVELSKRLRLSLPTNDVVNEGSLTGNTEVLLDDFDSTTMGDQFHWHDSHHVGIQVLTGYVFTTGGVSNQASDKGKVSWAGLQQDSTSIITNPLNDDDKDDLLSKLTVGKKVQVKLSNANYKYGIVKSNATFSGGLLTCAVSNAAVVGTMANNGAAEFVIESNIPSTKQIQPSRGIITYGSSATLTVREIAYTNIFNGSNLTCTLPNIAGDIPIGTCYWIRNRDSTALTVDPNSADTIEGTSTYSLAQNKSILIQADSSDSWIILAGN